MENREQTKEKSYEFTEDELRRILFAAEDVFRAIDSCHLRRENRERVDALQSKFHQAITEITKNKQTKTNKIEKEIDNGQRQCDNGQSSDNSRKFIRASICLPCERENGASIRVEIDAR